MQQVQQATALLEKGDYKKSLELYKSLWKKNPQEEYRIALCNCYVGRAKELTQKNMYREAVTMWENHQPHCTNCAHIIPYLHCLLAAKLYAKAALVYQKHNATAGADIEEIFAAVLLSGQPELEKALNPQSLLRSHLALANQALDAYNQGNTANVAEVLNQIPFRSPYKQLRQLLKASLLITQKQDQEKAISLLQSIPAHSPFYRLASLVNIATLKPLELTLKIPSFSEAELSFVGALFGIESTQLKLIKKLRSIKPNSPTLLDTLINHTACFEKNIAKYLAYSLLPFNPEDIKRFEKTYGALDSNEKMHIKTITKLDKKRACPHCSILEFESTLAHSSVATEPNTQLTRALILRQAFNLQKDTDEPEVMELLEKSLKLDPLDKATHLHVIQYHKEKSSKKTLFQYLENALHFIPNDREVLHLAITLYQKHGDFKKAQNWAKSLLTLDPRNSTAQQLLLNAKLKQIQTLITKKKNGQARKLLLEAKISEPHNTNLLLTGGLLEYTEKKVSLGVELIKQALPELGQDIITRVKLFTNADPFKIKFPTLEKDLDLTPTPKLKIKSSQELVGLIHLLRDENTINLTSFIKNHALPALKKATALPLTEAELTTLCDFFCHVKEYTLVTQFLKKQLPQHPDSIILSFFKIKAKVRDDAKKLSYRETLAIRSLLERCKEKNDIRLAMKIFGFIQPTIPDDLMDDDFDEDELPW